MPEFHALLDGYRRFSRHKYQSERQRWEGLVHKQAPPVMIIACCDSRVDPATIFDTEPGQAFVLRNVANIVPPFELGTGLLAAPAAIEFAVLDLGVRHIVVMGHGGCGGIKAVLDGFDRGMPGHSFVDRWIGVLSDARDRVVASGPENPQRALEFEGVRVSLANLRTFPFVAEREKAGVLRLHGCYFAIAEGCLYELDEAEGTFRPVPDTGLSD